jgi:hypothetical protein
LRALRPTPKDPGTPALGPASQRTRPLAAATPQL